MQYNMLNLIDFYFEIVSHISFLFFAMEVWLLCNTMGLREKRPHIYQEHAEYNMGSVYFVGSITSV